METMIAGRETSKSVAALSDAAFEKKFNEAGPEIQIEHTDTDHTV